ncbi:cyclase family protein [Phreatobacter aquaticus]|uniref:Cyclase family protein n=1 Tax=Phreatobacter aquaticus TaxID=2570229 RepID=A0A4D7QIQ9_9HYPH|nr:cyclase family protein [Phreatobacter aquaticus]QCK87550.1 cyclase family protein [Phreatobacter aquaticus]
MQTNRRWTERPPGSTWGDYGMDDQIGRLNLLTPERIRAAAREVREGLRFCLSLPLDLPGGNVVNPRRLPPKLMPTGPASNYRSNFPLTQIDPRLTDVVSDDYAIIHLQYSTQWDSFAHVGSWFDIMGDGVPRMTYYNGYQANRHVCGPVDYRSGSAMACDDPMQARALGIENFAATPIQGRGVMVDLLKAWGPGRTAIGYDHLMRAIDTQSVEVETGDLLCFRTGYSDALIRMAGNPDGAELQRTGAALDGRDERLLQWISDSGVAALIADNYAVEHLDDRPEPSGEAPYASLPLHEHCLFKLGVPLGEIWYLSELADWLGTHGRSRFLLTAPPLRLPGAVGSPVTPVATV